MKKGWQQTTLGEIAHIGAGNSAPQENELFTNGTHPFFRTSDAGRIRFGDIYESKDYLNDQGIKKLRRFPKSTILFPKSGASTFMNHRVMLGVEGYVSSHLATIIADEKKTDGRFLLYFLSTILAQDLIQDHSYPSLNLPIIAGISIPLPPLDEQQRIVRILDEAFEAIDIAKVNTEKNIQNARELFENYLNAIFAQRRKGWVDKRLGDIARTQYGLSESMNVESRGFKIFRMGEVQDGRLIDTGSMKYADIDKREFQKYKLQPGDILFNRTNSFELVGKTGIFDIEGDYCFASYLVRVLFDKKNILSEFLNYLMNSKSFQNSIKKKASKSINQANINATILSNEPVQFPISLEEQKNIVIHLNSLRRETQHLESIYQRKLQALGELKKSLLAEAFAGNL